MSFEKLYSLDVNDKTEKKQTGNTTLTYLSWSWAWAEFIKVYPTATYEIVKNENGLPYFADESGAMVYTRVKANEITHEMWLPVMDGANKAMKNKPYTYKTKFGDKSVEAYTMFDINKTLMRCLVKNLAMFGLGLYIYAGEDLPESPKVVLTENEILEIESLITKTDTDRTKFLTYFKSSRIEDVDFTTAKAMLEKKIK